MDKFYFFKDSLLTKEIKLFFLLVLFPFFYEAQTPCNLSNYNTAYVLNVNDYPYNSSSGVTVTSSAPGVPTLSNSTYNCGSNAMATNSPAYWLNSAAQQITLNFSAPVSSITVIFNGTNAGEEFYFASNCGTVSITNFCTSNYVLINGGSGIRYNGGSTSGNIATLNVPGGATEFYLTHNGTGSGSRIALMDCIVPATGGGGSTVIDPVSNINVCTGTSVPASNYTSTPSGASFEWSNSNTNIGLGASGTGNAPAFTATNATNNPISATITVTSPASGCSPAPSPVTYTITVNPPPTFTTSTTDPSCGNNNGEIIITPASGFTITDYSIDGGTTTQSNGTFSNLGPGTYNIVIIDNNGCEATGSVTLNNAGSLDDPSFSLTDFCEGTTNSATITGTPGGTFTIVTPTGDGASIDGSTGEITNGVGGTTYTVEYTTNGTCPASQTQDVTVNASPTFTTSTTDPSCGNNDGEIIITPASGFTITDYSIDGGTTTQSNGTFSNLGPGTYNIVIIDNNGCEATGSVTLNNAGSLDDPSFSLTDFCEGTTNSATITGTPGGTFTIVTPTGDGASIDGSTGEITNGVGGTTYTVEYTTNGTCPASQTQDVTVNASPTFTTSTTDPSCGNNDGEIIITPASGFAITDYSIDGGTTTQSNGTFSNLGPGTYNIVIIDNNGCEGTGTESLNNSGGITLNVVSSTDISCHGAADGSGVVSASGGTGNYTYSWLPTGGSAANASNLMPGTYTVTVTDDGGCSDDVQITIAEPDSISINETITPTDCGIDNGEIDLTVTGGSGNYSYTWNPGVSITNQATGLAFGMYEVTVTDDNGCSKTVSYNVPQGNSFYVEVIPADDVTIQQGESVSINLFVDPNVTVDNISWFPPDGLSCTDCKDPVATPDHSTTYIVAVTDDNGCVSTDTVVINVILPCAEIFVPNTFSPNADGLNDLQCVLGECIVSMDFTIFNRWGELVFQTKDQEECWNGKYRGKPVQSGTYIYKLKATLENGKQVEKTGNITVVR